MVIQKIEIKYSDVLNLSKISVSRLDIACNLPYFLNTHDGIISNKKNRLRKFYCGKVTKQNLTGIYIGKRGKESIQLAVYDKRYSPNVLESTIKHKTANFTRLEYQIGHKVLKRKYNINSLSDFFEIDNNHFKNLCTKLELYANVLFKLELKKDIAYLLSDFENLQGLEVEDPSQTTSIIE